jgi:hypothetical protein
MIKFKLKLSDMMRANHHIVLSDIPNVKYQSCYYNKQIKFYILGKELRRKINCNYSLDINLKKTVFGYDIIDSFYLIIDNESDAVMVKLQLGLEQCEN